MCLSENAEMAGMHLRLQSLTEILSHRSHVRAFCNRRGLSLGKMKGPAVMKDKHGRQQSLQALGKLNTCTIPLKQPHTLQ